MSFRQSGIPSILLFDDGMATRVKELLAPSSRVIVAIEPIGNLLIVPPFRTKPAYRVIQELLILGIGCNPKIGKTNFYGESEVNISVGRVDCLTTEQTYSTVTDLARLRGLSTSVPLINAA